MRACVRGTTAGGKGWACSRKADYATRGSSRPERAEFAGQMPASGQCFRARAGAAEASAHSGGRKLASVPVRPGAITDITVEPVSCIRQPSWRARLLIESWIWPDPESLIYFVQPRGGRIKAEVDSLLLKRP